MSETIGFESLAKDNQNIPSVPSQTSECAQPAVAAVGEETERRDRPERRARNDRRKAQLPFEGPDRRASVVDRRSGLERRRGAGIRRNEDRRSAEEGEMTQEQFEFVMAINEYKQVNRRPFPTWTEVLDVIRALGYRKVAPPGKIS